MKIKDSFKSYYLGLSIFSLLMLGGAVTWTSQFRFEQFRAVETQAARAVVQYVVPEIESLLEEKKRLAHLLLRNERELIAQALAQPADEHLNKHLMAKVREYFPDYFAVTLADTAGTPLFDDLDGLVGEQCHKDLRLFARLEHHLVRLHPNPLRYHYDIMVPIEPERGILFISFLPDSLARLLHTSQPDGHHLMLVSIDPPQHSLIEIAPEGERLRLRRDDYHLTPDELRQMMARSPVAGTDWQLVDFYDAQLYDQYLQELDQESWRFFLGLLILAVVLLISVYHVERQRDETERLLRKARDDLEHQVLEKTAQLRDRSGQLDEAIERQAQAEEDNQRLAAFTRESPYPVLSCRSDGTLAYANPVAERMAQELGLAGARELIPCHHLGHLQEGTGCRTQRLEETIAHSVLCYTYVSSENRGLYYLYLQDITVERQAQKDLEMSKLELESIFQGVSEVIVYEDRFGMVRLCNTATAQMFGYELAELRGYPFARLLDDGTTLTPPLADSGEISGQGWERYFRRKNGAVFLGEVIRSTLIGSNNEFLGFLNIIRDITERHRERRQLEKSEAFLRCLTSVLAEGLFVLDSRGAMVFMNPEAERLLGWTLEELMQSDVHHSIHQYQGYGVSRRDCRIQMAFETRQPQKVDSDVFYHRNGSGFPVSYTASPMMRDQGEFSGVVVAFQDITERKSMEDMLRRMATHDPVTGIPNRRSLDNRLTEEFERASRYDRPMGVLMMDLDHFKRVNDSFGHQAGDRVLQQFAELLAKALRSSDYLGRYGGEEFVVVLPETSVDQALVFAQRLRTLIASTLLSVSEEQTLNISASIGIGAYPDHGENVREILYMADSAVYLAKRQGRNRVEVASLYTLYQLLDNKLSSSPDERR